MLRRCMRKRQEHEQHKLVVLFLLPLSQSIIHFSRVYYIQKNLTAHKIVTIQALVRPMYLAVVVVDVFWLRSASIRGNSSNDFGVS